MERFGVEGIARSQALTDSVGVRLNRGAPCEATLPDAHRAYELARSILFPQECVRSAIMLSRLYSAGGRHREAVRFATVSRHCAAAVSFDSGVVAQAIVSLARAHFESGDLAAAESCAGEALALVTTPSVFAPAQTLRAEILHAQRRNTEALALIGDVMKGIEATRYVQGLGNALRVKAAVENALGKRAVAQASIKRALELLAQGSHPTMLRKAYLLSAAINRNARHARRARELTELHSIHD